MGLSGTLSRVFGRFGRDTRAVAAVEFALILPVMLLLYVGTSEAGLVISIDRRVQTVAGTVGDLVSRANQNLPACDLKDYFAAAQGIMQPYSAASLKQVVTAVTVAEDGASAKVVWSQAFGGGTAAAKDSAFALPWEIGSIAANSMLIVAEASYSYTPITNLVYKSDIPLRRENFFLPRFGGTITINPTSTSNC